MLVQALFVCVSCFYCEQCGVACLVLVTLHCGVVRYVARLLLLLLLLPLMWGFHSTQGSSMWLESGAGSPA
jgi:hypothetical protein